MKNESIKKIDTKLFAIPLPDVLSDAMHGDISCFELLTVTVTLDNGQEGTGYTYTVGNLRTHHFEYWRCYLL